MAHTKKETRRTVAFTEADDLRLEGLRAIYQEERDARTVEGDTLPRVNFRETLQRAILDAARARGIEPRGASTVDPIEGTS